MVNYSSRKIKNENQSKAYLQWIYNFTQLPALIDPLDIAVICGSAVLICLLAGLAPAWTAGRLQPVDALRHE